MKVKKTVKDFTDKELIQFMKDATNKLSENITPKLLRKAAILLQEYDVPKPYYIQVENPKEGGDPLDGWKPIPEIIYKRDIKNI